jgi:hypothetical protein
LSSRAKEGVIATSAKARTASALIGSMGVSTSVVKLLAPYNGGALALKYVGNSNEEETP